MVGEVYDQGKEGVWGRKKQRSLTEVSWPVCHVTLTPYLVTSSTEHFWGSSQTILLRTPSFSLETFRWENQGLRRWVCSSWVAQQHPPSSFVHWALTKGQYSAWSRTRWNPMVRCLVTKVPRYTHTSVPLSEAVCGGGAGDGREESCRTQQKRHSWGRLLTPSHVSQ